MFIRPVWWKSVKVSESYSGQNIGHFNISRPRVETLMDGRSHLINASNYSPTWRRIVSHPEDFHYASHPTGSKWINVNISHITYR